MVNKVVGIITGATIGYGISLTIALKYAMESKSVPEVVIIPTIIGGAMGLILS